MDKVQLVQNEIHNSLHNLYQHKEVCKKLIEQMKSEDQPADLINSLYKDLESIEESMNFFYNLDPNN